MASMLHRRRSFTLVEVILAVSLLAFALVALIGLLGISLSSEKSSSQDIQLATEVSYVLTTERTNSFATVAAAGYGRNYYFDFAGNFLGTNRPAATDPPPAYLLCIVTNVGGLSTNAAFLGANIAAMRAMFTYPIFAPAGSQQTNVIYFNRSNE